MAAVFAPFLVQDVLLDRELFAVFFLCAVIYQLLAADGSQRGFLATAGVCLGMAAMARDGLILLAPLMAVWLIADPWLRGRMTDGRMREGFGRVGAFAVGLMLVVVPVALRNYNVSGETVLLTTQSRVFMQTAGSTTGLSEKLLVFINRTELPDPVDYLRHDSQLPILHLPLPTWGWLAPAALAGLILSVTRWREMLVIYLIGGGYIAMAVNFNFYRYRMPVVPLMIIMAAYGAIEIATAVWRRRFIRVLIATLAILAGIVLINLTD